MTKCCRACQTVMAHVVDGLTRAVAPVAPHLAEDAWQNLPFPQPKASVFQAGWRAPPGEWGSLSEQDLGACRALLAVRAETSQVCSKLGGSRLFGEQQGSRGRGVVACHVPALGVKLDSSAAALVWLTLELGKRPSQTSQVVPVQRAGVQSADRLHAWCSLHVAAWGSARAQEAMPPSQHHCYQLSSKWKARTEGLSAFPAAHSPASTCMQWYQQPACRPAMPC